MSGSGEERRAFKTTDDYCDGDGRAYPFPVRAMRAVASAAIWLFSKIYWHWTVDGADPYTGRGGQGEGGKGRIVIANHASMLDPCLLVAYPTLKGSCVRPLYKSELDGSNLLGWFLTRIGAIPLNRGTADMKAIRRAVNAAKRGEDVLIFPEGTRIWDPDERPELHGGFALIAQMAGCDIVPCAIDGTERICPDKKGFPRPSRVRLRFGEPISFDIFAGSGKGRREQMEEMERIAMGKVYEMRTALRREHGRPVGADR